MAIMKTQPEWLSAKVYSQAVGVDKENRRINGMVVAQAGPFKTDGRGQFTMQSLEKIASLMGREAMGLKSRLSHPTACDDGISKFLGRISSPRLSKATIVRNGKQTEVAAVRGDLQLSDTAFEGNPNGNIGQYVLDLASSDPDALSSSLVLRVEKERQLDANGRPLTDDDGDEIAPVWHPVELHGCDLCSQGEAVDGLLSAGIHVDGLPLSALWRGTELLDGLFAGQSADVVRARCQAWLERYLAQRPGGDAETGAAGMRARRRRLRLAELRAKGE